MVEGTPSVQVCVGIVKGTLASDSEIVFDLKTQQAPIDSALGKMNHHLNIGLHMGILTVLLSVANNNVLI